MIFPEWELAKKFYAEKSDKNWDGWDIADLKDMYDSALESSVQKILKLKSALKETVQYLQKEGYTVYFKDLIDKLNKLTESLS